MFHILVVEDDENARKLMQAVLTQNGFHALPARDGMEALEIMDRTHVDLVVLDVMMPRMDGYTFARTLREGGSELPILMITARELPADKRAGFLAGTDDYMVKPVNEEEMILRIGALLRRYKIANEHRLTIGNTVLDYDAFTVAWNGRREELPGKEFLLLFKLLSYAGKIFTRRQLIDELWDMDTGSDERTVDVHINRLRDRFEENRDFRIVTVRGLGYKAVREG